MILSSSASSAAILFRPSILQHSTLSSISNSFPGATHTSRSDQSLSFAREQTDSWNNSSTWNNTVWMICLVIAIITILLAIVVSCLLLARRHMLIKKDNREANESSTDSRKMTDQVPAEVDEVKPFNKDDQQDDTNAAGSLCWENDPQSQTSLLASGNKYICSRCAGGTQRVPDSSDYDHLNANHNRRSSMALTSNLSNSLSQEASVFVVSLDLREDSYHTQG
jgi:hypothetical protein